MFSLFEGFSNETIQFLWGVRLNNHRDWFLAHKPDYLRVLYEPMKELAAEVQQQLLARNPSLQLNTHVTRIYRDARRVKYGGLYKDHLWFTLRPPVDTWTTYPCFYFETSPECYEFGMGYWQCTPKLMEQFRRRILRDPKPLERLARRLNRQNRFKLVGETYKRPKGEVSPLLDPWFNRKHISLIAEREYHPDSPYFTSALVDELLDGFTWLLPYYHYFLTLEAESLL